MFEIVSGIIKRPVLITLYGPPGTGKSLLASTFGKTLFADCESGTEFMQVDRVSLITWEKVLEFAQWAASQSHETIVFDSLTSIERMATTSVLKNNNWANLAAPDYGEGYAALTTQVLRLLTAMEWLRTKGKNVVLVAHSKVKEVKDPTQANYDRLEFDCNKNLVQPIAAAMDGIFLMRSKLTSVDRKGDKTTLGTGDREIILSDKGGALSKTRFNNIKGTVEIENEPDGEKLKQVYATFWKELINV